MTGTAYPSTERSRVRRLPQRGSHERETIHRILDEALVAHVGFVDAAGHPVVIPTAHARDGERLLLHGSTISRMARRLAEGVEVCVTVTLVDGLVLARSLFHHSMNYRSVVVLGRAVEVTDPAEKARALLLFSDHVLPGRAAAARGPSPKELAATAVLELPLAEATAKVRTGPPKDDARDFALPYWAGVVPLRLVAGAPEPAPDLGSGVAPPPVVPERGAEAARG